MIFRARPLLLLFTLPLLLGLSSCTTIEPIPQCYPLATYSPEFQARAAAQLAPIAKANPNAELVAMMNDYKKLYDLDKACNTVASAAESTRAYT